MSVYKDTRISPDIVDIDNISHPSLSVAIDGKKKRFCLDLETRVEIINYRSENQNISQRSLAKIFGCSKSQIQRILEKREEILQDWNYKGPIVRKRRRKEEYPEINQYLLEWFIRCRNSNIPLNDNLLRKEALSYAKEIGKHNFSASNGWLQKWKHRTYIDILNMQVAEENGDVGNESIESWHEHAQELMKNCEAKDIWNMDETGVFWKALPSKSIATKGGQCTGKNVKERLTWAFFVNAEGKREDPVVIGQSHPKCFSNLKNKSCPYQCDYYASDKSFMTSEILETILKKLDSRLGLENRKVLLFIDSAPCHSKELGKELQNIWIEFLPKDTTLKTQPLDAGIIDLWKVKFRKKLLQFVCSKISDGLTARDSVKRVTLLQSIQWGRKAWEEIDKQVILKCFQKVRLIPRVAGSDEEYDPFGGEDMMEFDSLCRKVSDCSANDQYVIPDAPFCEDVECIDQDNPLCKDGNIVKKPEEDNNDDKSDDDYDVPLKVPTFKTASEARTALEQVKDYAIYNDNEDLSNMLEEAIAQLR
ncbi:tigger transposable element-derived protein 6-like [Anneissia japonica]|uniref:tigger transposable element-derived protein 6-like n=1 Tax=Anneissia japonica TaxID=1529436 RepID=UPI0014255B14|nr:tigger transposable element-derived protein 6-like [Anneissia japonica]